MSLKLRLIIVFSILTLALVAFGIYSSNTIKYINEKNQQGSHLTFMTDALNDIEQSQLLYVNTNSRNEANNVFTDIQSMYDHYRYGDHSSFTNNQSLLILAIQNTLAQYEAQFTQLISLNDQLNALILGTEENINDLYLLIDNFASSGTSTQMVSDELRLQIITFYAQFVSNKATGTTYDNIQTDDLDLIYQTANTLKNDVSLPMALRINGLRLQSTLKDLEENLQKYKTKREEILSSSSELSQINLQLTEDVNSISSIQKALIESEQQRVYILTNALLILILMLFLGVIIYILKYVTSNLNQLLAATSKISQGDFTTQIDSDEKHEFGQLSHAVNHMANSLMEASLLQQATTDNLENLVQERTKALTDAKAALESTNMALEAEKERLALVASTDELTGLNNRRSILEALQSHINCSTRYNRPLTLMEVDLDRFKNINDEFGHLAGDEVLRKIANVFRKHTREIDIIGRIGGEEFLFIFPETDIKSSKVIIERIQEKVSTATFPFADIQVTFSGGVCQYTDETALELIQKVDHKLYEAKDQGRNRVKY